MYKVIKYFTDLHDNDHPYEVGDTFPREGIKVTEARLAELAGSGNKQGVPLIEPIGEPAAAPEADEIAADEAAPEEAAPEAEAKPKRAPRKKAADK